MEEEVLQKRRCIEFLMQKHFDIDLLFLILHPRYHNHNHHHHHYHNNNNNNIGCSAMCAPQYSYCGGVPRPTTNRPGRCPRDLVLDPTRCSPSCILSTFGLVLLLYSPTAPYNTSYEKEKEEEG